MASTWGRPRRPPTAGWLTVCGPCTCGQRATAAKPSGMVPDRGRHHTSHHPRRRQSSRGAVGAAAGVARRPQWLVRYACHGRRVGPRDPWAPAWPASSSAPTSATWQPYMAPLVFGADTPRARPSIPGPPTSGGPRLGANLDYLQDRPNPAQLPRRRRQGTRRLGGPGDDQHPRQPGAGADRCHRQRWLGPGWYEPGVRWAGFDRGHFSFGSWHSIPGQPQIEANWYFTATHERSARRSRHNFLGQAQDEAGNLEAPYEIARVLWLPQASPDIDSSSLTAWPTAIRPGERVTFTVVARNAGWQEGARLGRRHPSRPG